MALSRGTNVGPSDDAPRNRRGHDDHVEDLNPLQRLIQDWLDAAPGRSIRDLARAGGISHNTIYPIMRRDEPPTWLQDKTIEGLARGLGVGTGEVRHAAAQAAGYRVEDLDPESQEVQAWVALLADLPPQRRQELWEIGRLYLKRVKEETP